jgi:carboxyl-terminal processing protease
LRAGSIYICLLLAKIMAMFKRLLLVAAISFAVGQIVVGGVRFAQRGGFSAYWEANRRADSFREVLRIVNDHYVEEVRADYQTLTESALRGMLDSLDPHSEYLDRAKLARLRDDTSQQFGGIGVQIEQRRGFLTVVAPIAGTPGERAGLLSGDRIVQIDETSTERLSMDAAMGLLRGKPRSPVTLTVFRPATAETFERRIVREIIQVENVRDVRMLTPEIGYVRVLQFGERTGAEFLKALEELETAGMQALVLDLRNNPGGVLGSAIDVAQPFFARGELIAYTEGRQKDSRENLLARARGEPRSYPIAVLINSGSASASEIVAGALRDSRRAVLIGETTFGKGSVQSIVPLKNGEALRLTTALYYTPGGAVIHGRGIDPHVPVVLTVDEERQLLIQRSRLELMTPAEFAEQFGFEPIEDRQLRAALEILQGVQALTIDGV